MANDNVCDACGQHKASIGIGNALLCRWCVAEVRREIAEKRDRGEVTDVLASAGDKAGLSYRVPRDLGELAKLKAAELCRRTGKPVNWTDVVRQVLEAGLT